MADDDNEDVTRGTTILVVDDEEYICEYATEVLRDGTAARIEALTSAQELRWRTREAPPDLILLDASLGNTDGWQLARELKNDPETAWIALVGVSAIGSKGRALGLAAGLDGYIGKPFLSQELVDEVRRVLAARFGK